MNIIAVDDEYHALRNLERAILEAMPGCKVSAFEEPEDALSFAQETRVDVAFLDIDMSGMTGLELAGQLKKLNTKTNVIFVTGYTEYAVNAFSMAASGYVMKPVEPKDIMLEISRLRNPIESGMGSKLIQNLGPFTFEHTAKRVYRDNVDVLLTPREFLIFHFFAANPDVYFTPQELYKKTFGQDANDEYRALYTHISRLRKKLGMEDAAVENPIDIEGRRGKGYRLITHE